MRVSGASITIAALSGLLTIGAGPCAPAVVLVCPTGTHDDGRGLGNCVSSTTGGNALAVAPAIGQVPSSFYYLGYNSGFVLGNGQTFSSDTASNQKLKPDLTATFGKAPISQLTVPLDFNSQLTPISEAFTAVAVYSPAQAAIAAAQGYTATDPVTGTTSDLTGYIVAVGYAMTPSGQALPLIVRYTPRGALDTSFNGTGYVIGAPGGFLGGAFTMVTAVAIDHYGNVVIGGWGNSQPLLGNYPLYALYDADPSMHDMSDLTYTYYYKALDPLGNPSLIPTYLYGSNPLYGDEVRSFIARYTPAGSLDPKFDSKAVTLPGNVAPPSGSALNGFAVSPTYGYSGQATPGDRYDFIMGLAIDPYNGIVAVGGTSDSLYYQDFVATLLVHLDSRGVFDNESVGYYQVGSVFAPGTYNFYNGDFTGWDSGSVYSRDFYSAVTLDSLNRIVAAGVTYDPAGTSMPKPMIVRYNETPNSAATTATLSWDFSFGNQGAYSAYTPNDTTKYGDYVTSVAYDTVNQVYVVGGRTDTGAFINKVSLDGTSVSYSATGPLTTGYNESINGLAIVHATDGSSRYFAAGTTSSGYYTASSMITSFLPSLAQDSGFSPNPYSAASTGTGFTFDLYPFTFGGLPNFSYYNYFSNPYWQIGPDSLSYGGGYHESFTGIAPSADGNSAIVVGYTTDNPFHPPLTGRSFPILLFYDSSGNFVNMGQYTSFSELQNAL